MFFPLVTGLQEEDSLTLSSGGISSFNNPRVVDVVDEVVGARVVVVVVVGARVVDDIVVVDTSVVVVVVCEVGFGLEVYIKPPSKASFSFWQFITVIAFPSES